MTRTYTVYETPKSRQFDFQTPGMGTTTFRYSLIIRPLEDGEYGLGQSAGTRGTDDQEYQAAFERLQVYLGDQLGRLQSVSKVETSSNGGNLLGDVGSIRSVTFEPVESSDFVFNSVVTYVTEFPKTSDVVANSFAYSGSASIGYRVTPQKRITDIYKTLTTGYPGLPTLAQQQSQDSFMYWGTGYGISATELDSQGNVSAVAGIQNHDKGYKPHPMQIQQMRIEVTEPWTSTNSLYTNDVSRVVGSWPQWSVNVHLQGSRNDVAMLGAQPGTLLFMGSTVAPRQFHTYTITHVFLWDQWQHFTQAPNSTWTGLDNMAVITDASVPLGQYACFNDCVWVNSYPIAGNDALGQNGNATWDVESTQEDWRLQFANAATVNAIKDDNIFENAGYGTLAAGPLTR